MRSEEVTVNFNTNNRKSKVFLWIVSKNAIAEMKQIKSLGTRFESDFPGLMISLNAHFNTCVTAIDKPRLENLAK